MLHQSMSMNTSAHYITYILRLIIIDMGAIPGIGYLTD